MVVIAPLTDINKIFECLELRGRAKIIALIIYR